MFADGIDSRPISWMNESALKAEGLREPSCPGSDLVAFLNQMLDILEQLITISLDIAGCKRMGVGIVIVGNDAIALLLKCMADAGCTREEIKHAAAVGDRIDLFKNRWQQFSL